MYNFTLIKLTVFLIIGILIGFYTELELDLILVSGATLLIFFLVTLLISIKKFQQNILFGIATYLLFLYLGILTALLHIPENNPKHFSNLLSDTKDITTPILTGEILEELKPDLYHKKYILSALKLSTIPVKGKVLLLVNKDSSSNLEIGEKVVVATEIKKFPENLNPYQFDYGNYMRNLGVTHQVQLKEENLFLIQSSSNSIRSYAGKLRNNIIHSLKQQDLEKDELAVIESLLLGQRQDLSKELQQSYASAGIIHILAVSGLHVGIILWLLNSLLRFFDRIKYGKFLRTIILLTGLWGFALLTGLSPSVVRAVSMFSFVAIGLQLNRRTSVLNTLFASLFILLLINPYYLFQVGFQLSYLAIFAIVILQPIISKIYSPKNKLSGSFWKLITVSLAAQIGVLPLSLYYFHQFPGLFLISNIVVLPFMGFLLGIGILLIFLNLTASTPEFLPQFYGELISLLNTFVLKIGGLDLFVIKNVSFSITLCLGFYLGYLLILPLLKKITFGSISLALTAILIIQAILITESYYNENNELIIFHGNRRTDIASLTSQNLKIYSSNSEVMPTYLKNYELEKDEISTILPIPNIIKHSGKTILVLDSLGVYKIHDLDTDILMLTNSPKINLERVLEEIKPQMVIADGSNYKTYIKRWKNTLLHKKTPLHITGEKGAFNINHQYNY